MSHPGWMGKARHLSFHGTGRAMDFRAGKNPEFGGPTHQLVSILGGGELTELSAGSTQQRQDLQKVAGRDADVVRLPADLAARLAATSRSARNSPPLSSGRMWKQPPSKHSMRRRRRSPGRPGDPGPVRRIEEVRTLLRDPATTIAERSQKSMLGKVEQLSRSGLTGMPSWMVEAFAERGWQWGRWGGFADAMHCDYMGTVADVRDEAQYL